MVITSHKNIYRPRKDLIHLVPIRLRNIIDSLVEEGGVYTLTLKFGFNLGPKYNYSDSISSDDLEVLIQEVIDNFG